VVLIQPCFWLNLKRLKVEAAAAIEESLLEITLKKKTPKRNAPSTP